MTSASTGPSRGWSNTSGSSIRSLPDHPVVHVAWADVLAHLPDAQRDDMLRQCLPDPAAGELNAVYGDGSVHFVSHRASTSASSPY